MDYENIYKLQEMGWSLYEAKSMDSLGIKHDDADVLDTYNNEMREYRETCGLLTEMEEQSDRQAAFDDKLSMYMLEY